MSSHIFASLSKHYMSPCLAHTSSNHQQTCHLNYIWHAQHVLHAFASCPLYNTNHRLGCILWLQSSTMHLLIYCQAMPFQCHACRLFILLDCLAGWYATYSFMAVSSVTARCSERRRNIANRYASMPVHCNAQALLAGSSCMHPCTVNAVPCRLDCAESPSCFYRLWWCALCVGGGLDGIPRHCNGLGCGRLVGVECSGVRSGVGWDLWEGMVCLGWDWMGSGGVDRVELIE